jgi:hypothetical protein
MAMTETLTAEWIAEKLRTHRVQQKELAHALQIAPSGVTRLLQGERKLRQREIPLVQAFFSRLVPDVPQIYDPRPPIAPAGKATRERTPQSLDGAGLVPIYAGLSQRSAGDAAVDWRDPPAPLRTARGVFGFFIDHDRLAPLLLEGDVVYVHPGRPARNGARVVVEGRDGSMAVGLLGRDNQGRKLQIGGQTQRLDPADRIFVIAAIEIA